MSSESQMERNKSIIASVAEFGDTSDDVNELRWFGSNIPEAQSSVGNHIPTVNPETHMGVLENTDEYTLRKYQKQASVKFGLAPIPQSFNLSAAFGVVINKIGTSPRSIVAAVELLVNVITDNIQQSNTSMTDDDYKRLTRAQDKLIDIVGEDENFLLTSMINFIGDLINISGDESNLSADLLPQENDDSDYINDATLKPHRTERVGRPPTLPRLNLTELLSQETNDPPSGEVDTGPAVGNEVW